MHGLIIEASKTLVHGLVMPNSAARLRKRITPVLIKLYWILVRWRVQYKLLVFVCSALRRLAPGCILVRVQDRVISAEP